MTKTTGLREVFVTVRRDDASPLTTFVFPDVLQAKIVEMKPRAVEAERQNKDSAKRKTYYGLLGESQAIPCQYAVLSPTEPLLITQLDDVLMAWDLRTGSGRVLATQLKPQTVDFHLADRIWHKTCNKVALFSPDGKWLCCSTGTPTTIWDTSTWESTFTMKERGLCFSPDGTALAADAKGGVSVYETQTGKVLGVLPADCDRGIGFSRDGRYLALLEHERGSKRVAGSYEDDIRVIERDTGDVIARLRCIELGKAALATDNKVMAVADDGSRIAVLSETAESDKHCRVRIWAFDKVVEQALAARPVHPTGNGSETMPFAVKPQAMHEEFMTNRETALTKYRGKWVAMYGWLRGSYTPSPQERPEHFCHTLLGTDGKEVVRVYTPHSRQAHIMRFADSSRPTIIGLVSGIQQTAEGLIHVNIEDADIMAGEPRYSELDVPVLPAPPLTKALYARLKKGMTMEEVKRLFQGTGQEKWKERRWEDVGQGGTSFGYKSSMTVTVRYPGAKAGAEAILVFEGEKQLAYKLVEYSQQGLE